MSALWLDIRYALRTFRQSPGFVAVAVLALALGIGANSAIFSVLNAVLLRPLPYPHPDRLVMIWEDWQRRGGPREEFTNPANLADWREQAQSFEAMYGFTGSSVTLLSEGEPERILGAQVTPGLFATLGAEPFLGRAFSEEEERPGGPRVIVLTHGLWQRRFGSDAGIIGKPLLMSGTPFTVVGVMPAGVRLPVMSQAEFFVPLQAGRTGRGNSFLRVVGRLRPGATLTQARAEMSTIAARLAQQFPEANAEIGAYVAGLQEQLAGGTRTPLLILAGAVGCVLLIACANVANLLLARATGRRKEIAIRIALGAGRAQLLRQLLAESLLLGLAGAVLGLAFAASGVSALLSIAPNLLPEIMVVRVDAAVVLFTLAVGLLTGALFGLAPALQATRATVHDALKEGGSASAGKYSNTLRNLLAVAEIALSLLLLTGAALLLRSFFALVNVNPGFDPSNLVTIEIATPRNRYPEGRQVADFYSQLMQRMAALPQVESVAAATSPPFSQNRMDIGYRVEGEPPLPPGRSQAAWVRMVTPSYFSAARIPLIGGRAFDDRDTTDAPLVVIVNESFAKKHWPGANPLGKRISFGGDDGEPEWREVVGVAGNVRSFGLENEEPPAAYQPYFATPVRAVTLLVRSRSGASQIAPQLRSLIREMDREIPLAGVGTMEQRMAGSLAQRRFTMLLLGAFAMVALALAVVGIYGVMAYTVSQRTREMGIRMALGAARADVLSLIVGQGMRLALLGLVIGLAAALALARYISSQLYGVGAYDPTSFIAAPLVLLLAALAACWIPARRATRVDPLVALREE